jgi:hypothetical protein
MSYENEFDEPKYEDLCWINCPNKGDCGNGFYISTNRTHEYFKCVKCGSEWSSSRKEKKKDG